MVKEELEVHFNVLSPAAINMLATFLTIIVPGLGHLYYGYNRKGFLLIFLSILAIFFVPLYLILYPYALWNIWKISEKHPVPKFSKLEAIQIIVIAFVVPAILFMIGAVSVPCLFRYYQNTILFPNSAQTEGNEIIRALRSYHKSFSKYPDDLTPLIGGNPIKKRWEYDPWGNRYYYNVSKQEDSYTLLSCGPDGLPGTADDIIFQKFDRDQHWRE